MTESDVLDMMPSTTTGHLALFNQHLQKSNRLVEWIYSDTCEPSCNGSLDLNNVSPEVARGARTTPIWYVKVVVDGQFYGNGRGSTKKAARNEAAKVGLEKMGIFV